jgi:predicted esterase
MLRVLVLHGYTQDGAVLSKRMGALRKKCKNQVEFVFIDAPFQLSLAFPDQKEERTPLTWWHYEDLIPGSQELEEAFQGSSTMRFEGLEKSISLIKSVWDKDSFDGIMGFSQGASMVSWFLQACLVLRKETLAYTPRFAVLVSGFITPSPDSFLKLGVRAIRIPSLHVFSSSDKFVDLVKSEEMLQVYVDPEVLKHDQGHCVPQKKPELEFFRSFFSKFIASSS